MTPQQLKALLPITTTVNSSNNIENDTQKLYSVTELSKHFEVYKCGIRYYALQNNITPSKIESAKNGLYKYYKLSDFKNYKPQRRIRKNKINITHDNRHNYTILEIANLYNTNRHNINSYIRSKNISYVVKIAKTRGRASSVKLRHVKLEDFDFLKKQKVQPRKNIVSFTLIQRIKLLFGFDI